MTFFCANLIGATFFLVLFQDFNVNRMARAISASGSLTSLVLERSLCALDAPPVPVTERLTLLDAVAEARNVVSVTLVNLFDREPESASDGGAVTASAARILMRGNQCVPVSTFRFVGNRHRLAPAFVRTITAAARHNGSLQVLDLSDNDLDNGAVMCICDLVVRSTSLRTLMLSRCRMTSAHIAALADTIAHRNTTLTSLSLSGNNSSSARAPLTADGGDDAIARLVRAAHSLRFLDVSFCDMSNQTLPHVLNALAENTSLQHVNLRAYDFGVSDANGALFARVVRKNRVLKTWLIAGFVLNVAEQHHFVRNLWGNPRFVELWSDAFEVKWITTHWDAELLKHLTANLTRNRWAQPQNVWKELVELNLALAPLRLPAFVVLEILDRLPDMWCVPLAFKAGICVNVHRFYAHRDHVTLCGCDGFSSARNSAELRTNAVSASSSSPLLLRSRRPRSNSNRAVSRLRRLSAMLRPRTRASAVHTDADAEAGGSSRF
jgi:hypothetical protein